MTDQPTDVAALATIDILKILNRDAAEQRKLFEAAQSPGIFHLDFSNYREGVLDALDQMYALSDRYFAQSAAEKEKDVRTDQLPSQDRGYKKSENDETFEMADDELLRGGFIELPTSIADKTELIKRFNEVCHIASLSLLGSLFHSLAQEVHPSYDPDIVLGHHSHAFTSDTGLKLIYEPTVAQAADVVENKHTDSGTFTLLFYTEWGLHVFLPSTQRWAYAAPKPGCALVNVADSLQRLSKGVFHSPLHRVTQHEDGKRKRYYLSYFLRPMHQLKEQWAREDSAAAAAVQREGSIQA
ncbi:uncharacterized protein J3D65DRAFT_616071 [Phyllosticta citribraziliensis]|uniref:Isopenicillin N synthase-like Fe(2+) 2OG dioxygenase domain-containing protein n=1 Tax=Phyllosticta citribraziliensis TaxID=989973 RepID=A0ABR1LZM2_9PEZI